MTSLTSRAKFAAVNVYREMVKEIPFRLLDKPCVIPFYGCGALPAVLDSRRIFNNINTNKNNLFVYESNEVYNKYAQGVYTLTFTKALNGVFDYREDINMKTFEPKFSIRNLPYQEPGQGRANLYPTLLEKQLNHDYEWTADILPTAWLRGEGGDLKKVRKMFLDKMGLYKITILPFDAFSEFGANLETAIYYCKKGYNGPIEVNYYGSDESYEFNYRLEEYIIAPPTKKEAIQIYNFVKNYNHYTITQVNSKVFNKVKKELTANATKEKLYPVITKLKKKVENCDIKYTNYIFDKDSNKHRVVTSYLAAGWGKGDKHYGNIVYVPPGYQLTNTYKYIICDTEEEAIALERFLKSKLVHYLAHYWRTSRTADGPQWKCIPVLDRFDLITDNEIIDHFVKDLELQERIKNDKLYKKSKKSS
jgi:hypothetical protein